MTLRRQGLTREYWRTPREQVRSASNLWAPWAPVTPLSSHGTGLVPMDPTTPSIEDPAGSILCTGSALTLVEPLLVLESSSSSKSSSLTSSSLGSGTPSLISYRCSKFVLKLDICIQSGHLHDHRRATEQSRSVGDSWCRNRRHPHLLGSWHCCNPPPHCQP